MFYLLEILKLDSALEILYLNKDDKALTLRGIHRHLPFKVSSDKVAMILDKFSSDGFLIEHKKNAASEYFLTYKGVKFYQQGGYLKHSIHSFAKKGFKVFIVALGIISTLIGIVLGLRELI